MTELWVQYGQYKTEISTHNCENVDKYIKVIRLDPQLAIPENIGPITLLRSNGTPLKPGLKIAVLIAEDDFVNNDNYPLIVQISPLYLPPSPCHYHQLIL